MLAAERKTLNIKMNSWIWLGGWGLGVGGWVLSNLGSLHEPHHPVVIYKVLSKYQQVPQQPA